MRTDPRRNHGLSLIEVLLVLCTVSLIALVLLPSMPHRTSPGYGPRIRCLNNLKQVSLGFLVWANDREEHFPQGSTNLAGSMAWAHSPQVFHHFQVASNELVTPKILVCPSDPDRRTASDFVKFSNANLSYFVALDADESKPRSLLSGDRNITGGTLSNGFLRTLTTNTSAGWTTELHNKAGNVGLSDGSAQQVTEESMPHQLQSSGLRAIRLAIP